MPINTDYHLIEGLMNRHWFVAAWILKLQAMAMDITLPMDSENRLKVQNALANRNKELVQNWCDLLQVSPKTRKYMLHALKKSDMQLLIKQLISQIMFEEEICPPSVLREYKHDDNSLLNEIMELTIDTDIRQYANNTLQRLGNYINLAYYIEGLFVKTIYDEDTNMTESLVWDNHQWKRQAKSKRNNFIKRILKRM